MPPAAHLLPNLYVTCAGVEVFPPGASFGPTRMQDYEFVLVIEGGGTVYCDDRELRAGPGTILLWRPGMTDRYDFDTKRRTVQAYTHFNLELPASGWPPQEEWPFSQQMPPDDILRP